MKGPIRADDLYNITGRGHIFTCRPGGVPETVNVGDTVCFTSTNQRVIDDDFFDPDQEYRVVGIEMLRTLMCPPTIKGLGFVVSPVVRS